MKPTISTICLLLCTAVISGCATLEATLISMDLQTLSEAKAPTFPEASGKVCVDDKEVINRFDGNIPIIIANFSISPDLAQDLRARYESGCNESVDAYIVCAFDAQKYTLTIENKSLSGMRVYVNGLSQEREFSQSVSAALTHWGFVDKYDKQHETYRANDLATNKKILADAIEEEIGNRAVSCHIEYIVVGLNKSNDFLLDFGWMISELRK